MALNTVYILRSSKSTGGIIIDVAYVETLPVVTAPAIPVSWNLYEIESIEIQKNGTDYAILVQILEQKVLIKSTELYTYNSSGIPVLISVNSINELQSLIDSFTNVGNSLSISSVEITRPTNTTAYAAKDYLGSNISFTNAVNKKGGQGYITKVRLIGDVSTQTFKAKLHLYQTNPSTVTDNDVFTLSYVNKDIRLGSIELPALSTEGTGSTACYATWTAGKADSNGLAQGILPIKADSASTTIYGILETLDAFTPTSAGKYFVEITVDNI